MLLPADRLAPSSIVVCLILSALGCGPTCPAQPTGCNTSTTIQVPLPSGEPEVYEIALTFRTGDEAETDRCLAILPPPNDWTANLPVSCLRNSASVYVVRDADVDCTVSYPEGASCSVSSQGFVLSILRYARVDRVELQLTRGNATFLPVTMEPSYGRAYPDGPECPGACDVATTVVAFAALVEPAEG